MFGLTLGGLVVYLLPKLFLSEKNDSVMLASIGALGLSLFLFSYIAPTYNPKAGVEAILNIFALASIPFFAGSIFLTVIFTKFSASISKIYASDLIGAGVGVVISVLAINYINIAEVITLATIAALTGFAIFSAKRKKLFWSSLILLVFVVGFTLNEHSKQKPDLAYNKFGEEKDILFSKWNSFSRITVQKETTSRETISISPKFGTMNYKGSQLGIAIDADAYTPVMEYNGNPASVNFLTHDLSATAYQLTNRGKVLIIGPGGGRDVLTALIHKNNVRGVDVNPIIINDLMKDKLRDFSGNLYGQPGVEVSVNEGRSFIQKDKSEYEVINLPLVDTWASTVAGNLSLVEGYLYTTEAFEEYLGHLTPNGALTISRWSMDGDRLLSLFVKSSEKIGITNPEQHVLIISRFYEEKIPWLNNYIFSRSPLTKDQIKKAELFAKTNGFHIIYAPDVKDSTQYSRYMDLIESAQNNDYSQSDINLYPVYDDTPFFFMRLPVKNILAGINWYNISRSGVANMPDGGLSIAIVLATIFAIICLLLPLFFSYKDLLSEKRILTSLKHITYFGLLGVSFMFLEIALIQKFILYLEYPVYSYSVVLTTILIFGGIGSFLSSKIDAGKRANFYKLSLLLAGLLIISGFIAQMFFANTLGWPIIAKISVAIGLNGIVAVLMGMMMPLGFKRLEIENLKQLLPWCWAFNGALSILASVAAIIIAIQFGFSTVLIVGALGYILAGFIYNLSSDSLSG